MENVKVIDDSSPTKFDDSSMIHKFNDSNVNQNNQYQYDGVSNGQQMNQSSIVVGTHGNSFMPLNQTAESNSQLDESAYKYPSQTDMNQSYMDNNNMDNSFVDNNHLNNNSMDQGQNLPVRRFRFENQQHD